jgi:heat shock factor-binding protein 1
MSDQVPTQPEDLANFMDQIFAQMETKFTDMAQQVLGRIDEMTQKINDLETTIDNLMNEADPDGGAK